MVPLEVPYILVYQQAISTACTLSIDTIYSGTISVQYYFVPNKDYGRLGAVAMRYGMDLRDIGYTTEFTWLKFNFSSTDNIRKPKYLDSQGNGRIWPDFEVLTWWWGGPGEHPTFLVIQNITIN